jgi:hypothetical protein
MSKNDNVSSHSESNQVIMITSHAHRQQCFRSSLGKERMVEWTTPFMIGITTAIQLQ